MTWSQDPWGCGPESSVKGLLVNLTALFAVVGVIAGVAWLMNWIFR